MTEVRLTEKQRRFAEEQHHILIDFLQGRSLAMDEFYDIVVFPFLEAVCNYDAGRDFIDESFEVFAGRCMREAVGRHFAEEKKGKKDAVILSLDYPVSYTDGLTFGDTIADLRVNPLMMWTENSAARKTGIGFYIDIPAEKPYGSFA